MDPVTISGLIFAGLTTATIIKLNLSKVDVPRYGRWKSPPNVLVSRSAPVSLVDVQEAVSKLKKLGYEFGEVKIASFAGTKVKDAITIVLRTSHFDEAHAGETHSRSVDGWIQWSSIEIPDLAHHIKDNDDDYTEEEAKLIITHELGHAVGLKHVQAAVFGYTKKGAPRFGMVGQKTGHLMNRMLSLTGWNMAGMEAKPSKKKKKKKRSRRKKL